MPSSLLLDATQEIGPGDRRIAERVTIPGTPVILVVNKVDVASRTQILAQLTEAAEWDFHAYVPSVGLDGRRTGPVGR